MKERKKDWVECSLGDIFETITGNTPSKKDKNNYGNVIPFIKPPQINNNFIDTYIEYLSEKGAKKARVLPKNSVLITCIGNLGRVGFNKDKIAFNQQINAIKPTEYIIPKFTFYQAQSINFRKQLEELSTSTTVKLVNKTNFNTVTFKITSLVEQKAIVKKIEELFSSLDSGIADLKKAQEQLKTYRQAVLKKAFNLNSKKYRIEEVCKKIFAGGDKPNDFFSVTKSQELSIPIFANAVSNKGLYGYTKEARVKSKAITIAARGSGTGHVELREEPFLPIVRLITIIPNLQIVEIKFLMYFFKNLKIKRSGSAIPQLTIPMIKEYEIYLPTIQEQKQIVQEIESRLSVCDAVEQNVTESLEKAQALRQSILKKAFDGTLLSKEEIAQCKNHKEYEPASVLLEKIKAEKEKKNK